jgi:multidrug efflux pump subunit AcrA (membrane-fusion protein)
MHPTLIKRIVLKDLRMRMKGDFIMKILYQSDITGKTYESEAALVKAEAEVSKAKQEEELKKKERAEAAKAVQAKLDAAKKAQKEAQESLVDFCKKYGTFKTSLDRKSVFDPFSFFFDPFEF